MYTINILWLPTHQVLNRFIFSMISTSLPMCSIDSFKIIALSLFVKWIQILISYMVMILLQVSNEEHSGLVDFGISGYGHAVG